MTNRPQKIVLVEPAAEFNAYQFVRIPLIGLLYVATTLKRAGHDVTVLSEATKPVLSRKNGRLAPELISADVVGVSTMTPTADRAYEIARAVKKASPNTKIILGGIHSSLLPDEAAEHADVVLTGEGENAVLDAVRPDFDGHIVRGGLIEDLDTLPFPDYELEPDLRKSLKYATISASRGCPYDCSFCCVTKVYGRKVRFRSVESVTEEIELRYKQGYRNLFFGDDNFAANRQWTKRLLTEISRRQLNVSWVAQSRAEIATDPELLDLISATNCRELFIGFEAVTQDSLDRYNKQLRVEEVIESVRRLNEHKISICGMFIIGADSDNIKTTKETLRFCKTMRLRYAQFSILAPFPGTRVASDLTSEGRIFDHDFRHYDGAHVVFRPANFSPLKLQRDVLKLWRDFYSLANGIKGLAARYFLNRWRKANKGYLAQLRSYTASLKGRGVDTELRAP
ncbi:MAG TPA: radical SAM protein [bacterium]|nr:radical SAM protein [bacterium]